MTDNLYLLPIWYLAFIISITLHEFAHSLYGLKLGNPAAAESGQVTLNPIPHMKREIVGTVVVPLFTFFTSGWMIGWASAPFDLNWAKSNPKKFALMSLAGPGANLLIVIVILFITNTGYFFDILLAPDTINFSHITEANFTGPLANIAKLISILFSLNVMLFVFNLLPLPILDGGSIPLFFIDRSNSRKYIDRITDSRMVLPAIFIAWYIFEFVHEPVRNMFLNLLYLGITYS